ncbi:hypothetical protein P879_04863 [Paragonimus westermani]|uniref:enoyl-CoA hydratase n=1 Tax=Paragonimus westermani TaxID=34504 RepID=A0A8T0DT62_9TREM|nr:hypothetical protein P879_04863 [Paragonimus westermani]
MYCVLEKQLFVSHQKVAHIVVAYLFLGGAFEYIAFSKVGAAKNVGFIRLNRPKALNALCAGLIMEVSQAMNLCEADDVIKAVVLTGDDNAFAAGADIKGMVGQQYSQVYRTNFLSDWDRVALSRKPIIAAVCGYALGGGCELAMMCDIIYASTIPGAGGTQRLIRAIGKSRAMELILTGDTFSAEEAAAAGLVSRIFPTADVVPKAIELGEKIGKYSSLATQAAKEAVNAAFNMTLNEGLRFEKRLFHASFATNDFKEGIKAFVEKRDPKFTDT